MSTPNRFPKKCEALACAAWLGSRTFTEDQRLTRTFLSFLGFTMTVSLASPALAVRSSELYSGTSYGYGRVEARMRFAGGDGVVSSFFAWKEGSEVSGTFWNELDFEKVNTCLLKTNPLYGNPAASHGQDHTLASDLCGEFHTYAYEWTPEAIVWFVDGAEIRRETGATATAFAENAGTAGMQIHFNVWPGDATFGGNFDPSILPVHQYIDWVQFSSYADGAFTLAWREDFDAAGVPSGWLTGSWASPKNLSTHDPGNVNFLEGYAVLSLTADDAVGPAGAMPGDTGGTGGMSSGGAGGSATAGGAGGAGGSATAGGPGAGGNSGSAGAPSAGGSAGAPGGGATGNATSTGGAGAMSGVGSGGASGGSTSSGGGCSLAASGEGDRVAWLAGLCLAAMAALRRRAKRELAAR
jgi:endo-1,3-1,4-beta-glycanase ExoK